MEDKVTAKAENDKFWERLQGGLCAEGRADTKTS